MARKRVAGVIFLFGFIAFFTGLDDFVDLLHNFVFHKMVSPTLTTIAFIYLALGIALVFFKEKGTVLFLKLPATDG